MKVSVYIFALSMVAGAAEAQSIIDQRCGPNHINQIATQGDLVANPDGYYVRSLQTQLSHGDPRIVQAVGREYHLCTRPASTPDMDTNQTILFKNERTIKYLFVPSEGCPKPVS